jgi:hypothetical protein
VNDENYIGLDVHQATIVVAVMDSTGKVVMVTLKDACTERARLRALQLKHSAVGSPITRYARGRHVLKLILNVPPALGEPSGLSTAMSLYQKASQCLLNPRLDHVLEYYVAPRLGQWKYLRLYRNDLFLRETVRLDCLSDFYVTVKKIWEERSNREPVQSGHSKAY